MFSESVNLAVSHRAVDFRAIQTTSGCPFDYPLANKMGSRHYICLDSMLVLVINGAQSLKIRKAYSQERA